MSGNVGRRIGLVVSFVFMPAMLLALVLAPGAGARSSPVLEVAPSVVEFTAYEGNPVVEPGPSDAWDELIIGAYALSKDGVTYLFYTGWLDWFPGPLSIGYVTSTNGIDFSERLPEPILAGDGAGFDSWSVGAPVVLLDGNTWTMFYAGDMVYPHVDGEAVGMATADDPAGPWVRLNHAVLRRGNPGEWDDRWVTPMSVVVSDGVYILYYSAASYGDTEWLTGMATSDDGGYTWTKYDDPATTEPPYAESDPVLIPGDSGDWDENGAYGTRVRRTSNGWEMFYSGRNLSNPASIGYAWSADGIHWAKHPDNPIYTPADDPNTDRIEMPTFLVRGSTYWMYYDYGVDNGIGLATGTVRGRWRPIRP